MKKMSQTPFGCSRDLDQLNVSARVFDELKSHKRLSAAVVIWTIDCTGDDRSDGSRSQTPFGCSRDLDMGKCCQLIPVKTVVTNAFRLQS